MDRASRDTALDEALLLVVDAIPWHVARAAWGSGRLPDYAEPRPLVSTFPSLTNVALAALLTPAAAITPPGYEAFWVDPTTRRVRGGLGREADEPGLLPFRGRPEGLLANLVEYALRATAARWQLSWLTRRFVAEGGPWLGYLSATDAIGHFEGEAAQAAAFLEICDRVETARDDYARRRGVRPAVVMCSDHGMAFDLPGYLPEGALADAVAALGLTRGASGLRGFQLAPLGEVGAGAVWCAPECAVDVAEAVAGLPGVDVASALHRRRNGDTVLVLRAGARAEIARTSNGLTYVHDGRDPLLLEPRLVGLRGVDGALDADAVLAATWDAWYPDALRRLLRGHGDLVRWPAQVLFSMAPGWVFGRPLARRAARMVGSQVGTHGGLDRAQTLGFVAASREAFVTTQGRAPAVRAEEAFAGVAEALRRGCAETPVLGR